MKKKIKKMQLFKKNKKIAALKIFYCGFLSKLTYPLSTIMLKKGLLYRIIINFIFFNKRYKLCQGIKNATLFNIKYSTYLVD